MTGASGVSSRRLSGLGPFFALLLACAYFASRTDRFLTGPNLSLVVQQSMVVGVLAIGQTLIILTAGIDLSCGAVMALGVDRDDPAGRRQWGQSLLAIAARNRRLRRIRRCSTAG